VTRNHKINFWVTEAEKHEFEQYVEQSNEFDSLSRMFRVLAHRHINSDDEREASVDSEEIVDAVDVAVSDVHERLERIEDNIGDLGSEVSTNDEINQLTHKVVSELPVHSSADGLPSPTTEIDSAPADSVQMARQLSTPGAWASYFDVSVKKMRRALGEAQTLPDVRYVEVKGSRRYYKTGGGE
jgi:hypothetical protein